MIVLKKYLKELWGAILVLAHNILMTSNNQKILSILLHNPSLTSFEALVKWLLKHKYKIISLAELEVAMLEKNTIGKTAVITFDDGWRGNLDLIETVERLKVPIAIFVPTEPVESGNYWFEYARLEGQHKVTGVKSIGDFKKLPSVDVDKKIKLLRQEFRINRSCISQSELRKLAKHPLVTIGSHTVTHPILKNCTEDVQTRELVESKNMLQLWINSPIKYVAYPNGDYDEWTLGEASKAGYNLGFTVEPKPIDVRTDRPYALPRCPLEDESGIYENIAKSLGIWRRSRVF